MSLTPRCYTTFAAGTGATVVPPLTGWTNAGLGVSGTAPVTGDLVVVITGVNNNSTRTFTQTAGTGTWGIQGPDAQFSVIGGVNVGLDSAVSYRVFDGTETAPTFTWSNGGRNSWTAVAFSTATPTGSTPLAPMGCSLNLAPGTAGYPTADNEAVNWGEAQQIDTFVFNDGAATKWAQKIQKIFANPGDLPANGATSGRLVDAYSYWPNLNAYVNTHGGKVLVSLRPHWSTYNTKQGSQFTNTVTDINNKLGHNNWKLVLWSEANGPKSSTPPIAGTQAEFANATDYHNYWDFYAKLARGVDPNISLVYDPQVASGTQNGGSGNQSGAVSYCPLGTVDGTLGYLGPDEIYVDYYCTSHKSNQKIDSLVAKCQSVNPNGAIPFGLGEWGLAASDNPTAKADWNSYITYLRDTVFGPRQTAGLPLGWCLFWAYNGSRGGTGGGDLNGDGIVSSTDKKIGNAAGSSSDGPGILYFLNGLSA